MSEIEGLVNKWLEGQEDKEIKLELCEQVADLTSDSLYFFLEGIKNAPDREMAKIQRFIDTYRDLQTYRLEALPLVFAIISIASNEKLENLKKGLSIAREPYKLHIGKIDKDALFPGV